jgi:hypothetical protein
MYAYPCPRPPSMSCLTHPPTSVLCMQPARAHIPYIPPSGTLPTPSSLRNKNIYHPSPYDHHHHRRCCSAEVMMISLWPCPVVLVLALVFVVILSLDPDHPRAHVMMMLLLPDPAGPMIFACHPACSSSRPPPTTTMLIAVVSARGHRRCCHRCRRPSPEERPDSPPP